MLNNVIQNQPRQKLLFYVDQDVNEDITKKICDMVDHLAVSRSWLLAPPRVVTVDTSVGGELEIYSALPPMVLEKDVDRKHLDEVEDVVEAVRKLSESEQLVFEFELDGTYVGTIEDGEIDRTLRVGLLDEWRSHLNTLI